MHWWYFGTGLAIGVVSSLISYWLGVWYYNDEEDE